MAHSFALIVLMLFSSNVAWSSETERCYLLRSDTPESKTDSKARHELWCYQELSNLEDGLFIYNADLPFARPELALIMDAHGTITHGSLLGGKLTFHTITATQFNPFSIPLKEPTTLQSSNGLGASNASDVLALLMENRGISPFNFSLLRSPDRGSSAVLPWRGHWWPYKNRPLQRGPYARFDAFVTRKTGFNPGAVAWEDANHAYNGIWWEGHCNGWAAASILRAEPRFARADSSTGIVFSVSDQKAYLSGIDYCVNSAFFGERYRNSRSNPRDILPHVFHKTLLYYLGALRKPVVLDYRADATVDNHVISGYRMQAVPIGQNLYQVTANLNVHKYDGKILDRPGIAPSYTRIYKYTLQTDNNGNPIGGKWLSPNPDFLWVPLSPRSCSSNNQNLKREWVNAIMSLPAF